MLKEDVKQGETTMVKKDSQTIEVDSDFKDSTMEDVPMPEMTSKATTPLLHASPQSVVVLSDRARKDLPELPAKEPENKRLQQEIARLRSELLQLNNRFLQSDHENTELRQRDVDLHEAYLEFCEKTNKDVKDANDRGSAAEEEERKWKLKAKELSDELSQCKDELFSLQPQWGASDTQIGSDWDSLCEQITRWVDDEAEFTNELLTQLTELKQRGYLTSVILKYWAPDRQLIVNRYELNDDLDWLVRYNIHCLLESFIFNETVCLFGLTEEDSRLIKSMEKSLSTLKPQRDQSSIDRWRAEALNAMLGIPTFRQVQFKSANKVTREAEDFLRPLLPNMADGAMKRFHTQITLPAIELASLMRCSPARYYFVFTPVDPCHHPSTRPAMAPQRRGRYIHRDELEVVSLVDVDSRKALKSLKRVGIGPDGSIAEEIMLVHPGLCRYQGGRDITLGKPEVLVRVLNPLSREHKKEVDEGE